MAGPHRRDHMGPFDVFRRVSFAGFVAILATGSVQSYAAHRAGVRGGPAADPRGPPSRCPPQDRHRTPVERRANVRGAPDVRRRVEVDALLSFAEAHEPRSAASDQTGAGERLLDQRPGGGPEAPPGEPIELPGRRRRPLRRSLDESPDVVIRLWPIAGYSDFVNSRTRDVA